MGDRLVCLVCLLFYCLPGVKWVRSSVLTDIEKPVPIVHVSTMLADTAILPCDIRPDDGKDEIFLILWFKDNATKPMYSLDVMGKSLEMATQWADTSSLGKRSSFRTHTQPTALLVDSIMAQDTGIYRCRVDYRDSPTKNLKINLTIIVPPNKPVIQDKNGMTISGHVMGPLEVGDTLQLTCAVEGGSPAPYVTWWKEGTVYDNTYTDRGTGVVINAMNYPNLKREDLGAKFICQAANSNKSIPLSKEIHISLNLKPTGLQILEKPTYVSEGKERSVTCQATGGYPPPHLTWWIGTRQLTPQENKKEYQGVATSKLVYIPAIEDDGRYLTCRVSEQRRNNHVLEDNWEIKVLYKPQVSLRLGKSLDPDNLRTGNDVYFECDIRANPIPHKLLWRVNGQQLKQNTADGIIMSTQSLVLQKVTRDSIGDYTCEAINSEGSGTSNPVPLHIMYPPVCRDHTEAHLLGVGIEKPTVIGCELDAYPPTVSFRWFFNNSDYMEWIDQDRFDQEGLKSQFHFMPKSSKDYGNLYCIGENAIGTQEEPCVFNIVPTGKPSALTDCKLVNKSLNSMKVECSEGFDGGLPANFLLEMYEANTMQKTAQVTNKVPIFEVHHLQPGVALKLYLYAENAKGTSEPAKLDINVANQEKHFVEGVTDSKAVKGGAGKESGGPRAALVVIISGAGAGFVFFTVIVCVLVTCRRKKRRNNIEKVSSDNELDSAIYVQNNEQYQPTNPDLIPPKNYGDGTLPNTYCSDLDSTLLISSQRANIKGAASAGNLKGLAAGAGVCHNGGSHRPAVVHGLENGESVALQDITYSPDWRNNIDQQQTPGLDLRPRSGTLGRRSVGGCSAAYPLYHTCHRPAKKRVTIVEANNEESSV